MQKSRTAWPEIVFGGGAQTSRVSRAAARGELKKIGPALYTSNLESDPAAVVARHLWMIVAHYAPNAVVTHRTAFEGRPSADRTVFVTGPVNKRLDVPGLQLRMLKGPGPLPGDQPFMQGLTIASEPRMLLENLALARERGGVRRTVSREDVERRLDAILRARGETALNALRDQARQLAPALHAARAFELLDALVGALLRSRPATVLRTPTARARAHGLPVDPGRVERFELLARRLATLIPTARPDPVKAGPAFEHLAFFDAYFSNYIEGTEFEVEEAHAIVFKDFVPERRPADAHDVLGTYRLVGDKGWLAHGVTVDRASEEFLGRLASAHATLMAGRPEVGPGQWKTVPNRAGNTVFVEPDLVQGTLVRGWELTRSLRAPFHRAAMIMFVINEVHPFTDGNGRTARAFMNAELVAADERRILIPIVFREDYLSALRALSRHDEAEPFMLMLDRAQRFAHSVRWENYETALVDLTAANAFAPPEPGIRLRVPATAL